MIVNEQKIHRCNDLVQELTKSKQDKEKIQKLMEEVGIEFSKDEMICLERVLEHLTSLKTERPSHDLR